MSTDKQQGNSGYSGPAHLEPYAWRKGQSGNPAGRPPGPSIGDRLREILDTPTEDGRSVADVMADAAVTAALGGDYRFWREIMDRAYGPASATEQGETMRQLVVRFEEDNPV